MVYPFLMKLPCTPPECIGHDGSERNRIRGPKRMLVKFHFDTLVASIEYGKEYGKEK